MVEVEIVVVYLFVGIVFYSQTEGKTCESEECESNCVRRDGESDDELIERVALINPFAVQGQRPARKNLHGAGMRCFLTLANS